MHWSVAPFASSYSIARGDLAALASGDYGARLATRVPVPAYDDDAVPEPDRAFVYLIRGRSAAYGLGSEGNRGDEALRSNSNPAACL